LNEFGIISKSIKDFLTPKMLKIALIPLFVTMIIIYSIFFTAAEFGINAMQEIAQASQNGGEVIIDEDAPFYFVWMTYTLIFLFKYSITSWLAAFLLYTIGTVLVLKISILLTIVVIGFLSPMILNILHKRHYSHLTLNPHGDFLSPLFVLFKSALIMILLFIVLIPLYFIPLLNIIAFSLPFYYFFHKLLNYDVSSTILSKDEFRSIYDINANAFRGRTLLLYIISLIPFITLFTGVFFVIYLGHAYFIKLDKLQSKKKYDFKEETKNLENSKLLE
jgi:hypothetical protein